MIRDLSCAPLLLRFLFGRILRRGLTRRRLRLGRCLRFLRPDRLDLDFGQRRTEARMPLVAGLRAVLADPDLLPAPLGDDLRRHLDARREVGLAVASSREEHVGMEGLALAVRDPVDKQALALLDAVLLSAE